MNRDGQMAGPKLCDLPSWLSLTAGVSSRNLGPNFLPTIPAQDDDDRDGEAEVSTADVSGEVDLGGCRDGVGVSLAEELFEAAARQVGDEQGRLKICCDTVIIGKLALAGLDRSVPTYSQE